MSSTTLALVLKIIVAILPEIIQLIESGFVKEASTTDEIKTALGQKITAASDARTSVDTTSSVPNDPIDPNDRANQ